MRDKTLAERLSENMAHGYLPAKFPIFMDLLREVMDGFKCWKMYSKSRYTVLFLYPVDMPSITSFGRHPLEVMQSDLLIVLQEVGTFILFSLIQGTSGRDTKEFK